MQKYLVYIGLFLCTEVSTQPVAVMLDKLNVLYNGIPNELQIVVSDLPAERLVLAPSQGEIAAIDTSQGKYTWKICESTSKQAWLVLQDALTNTPLDTLYFRVKQIPEPQFLKTKPGHHGESGIGFRISDQYYSKDFYPKVLGFDVTILPRRQDALVYHNNGARFSGDVSEAFKRLVPGDAVFFYNITWQVGCDPTVRHSDQELAFKLK